MIAKNILKRICLAKLLYYYNIIDLIYLTQLFIYSMLHKTVVWIMCDGYHQYDDQGCR